MGGHSGGGGSGGGTQNTTTTNKTEIPWELSPLYQQSAQNMQAAQSAIPLTGSYGYGQYEANPAYAEWQKQYGQYNMPQGGTFYTSGGPQAPFGYMYDQSGQMVPDPGVNTWQGSIADYPGQQREGTSINIPAAPPQMIGVASSLYEKTPDFTAAHPMGIAGLSELEKQANQLAPTLLNTPEAQTLAMQYAQAAPGVAGQTVSSQGMYDDFTTSPYYTAALEAFNQGALPQIQNQMALSGLGRSSSLGNAMALGWGQQVPQILSQYATQYVEPELARQENAINRQLQAYTSMAPVLSSMGLQDTARISQTIDKMREAGISERSIEQAVYEEQQKDFLRRQALAEEALYTPAGMMVPSAIAGNTSSSTIGSTNQSTKTGGGGLFK